MSNAGLHGFFLVVMATFFMLNAAQSVVNRFSRKWIALRPVDGGTVTVKFRGETYPIKILIVDGRKIPAYMNGLESYAPLAKFPSFSGRSDVVYWNQSEVILGSIKIASYVTKNLIAALIVLAIFSVSRESQSSVLMPVAAGIAGLILWAFMCMVNFHQLSELRGLIYKTL